MYFLERAKARSFFIKKGDKMEIILNSEGEVSAKRGELITRGQSRTKIIKVKWEQGACPCDLTNNDFIPINKLAVQVNIEKPNGEYSGWQDMIKVGGENSYYYFLQKADTEISGKAKCQIRWFSSGVDADDEETSVYTSSEVIFLIDKGVIAQNIMPSLENHSVLQSIMTDLCSGTVFFKFLKGDDYENDFYKLNEISVGEYILFGFSKNLPIGLNGVTFILKIQAQQPQVKEYTVSFDNKRYSTSFNPRGAGWGEWKTIDLSKIESNQGSSILFTELNLAEEVGNTITASQSDFEPQTTPKQYDCVIGANGYMGQITNETAPFTIKTALKIKGEKGENAPKPVYSAITVNSSSWVADTTKEPFTHKATVTASLSLTDTSVVELVNDNPSLFMTYAFSIFDDGVTSNAITVYSIGKPTEDITLKVGVTE